MKKLILFLLLSALASAQNFTGGTIAGNILPDTTGRNLGSGAQQWNAFIQSMTLSGQLTSSVTTGTAPFIVASTTLVTNLHAANSDSLGSATFAAPGAIGTGTPSTGKFTTVESTITTGTAPFIVASTTNVANLNAATLNGATFAAPGAIGGGTPSSAAHTTGSFTGQVTSTLASGTAPLVITSTTPVVNLTAVPTTYNAAGTQITGVHIVRDVCTLGTSCVVTLAGSAAFTDTAYQCACADQTATAACKIVNTGAGTITITGTGTDIISYICVGK